jgi:hypothetical protein
VFLLKVKKGVCGEGGPFGRGGNPLVLPARLPVPGVAEIRSYEFFIKQASVATIYGFITNERFI